MEQKFITELLSCPKVISSPPKKLMCQDKQSRYTLRNDFLCTSVDGKYRFSIFMRLNTEIPTLFSIGIRYRSETATTIICRYNGKHVHKNKIADNNSFDAFHIHCLYDDQLTDGTSDSLDAVQTDKYITFDEALYAFLNDMNISGWEKYFPTLEEQVNQTRIGGVLYD